MKKQFLLLLLAGSLSIAGFSQEEKEKKEHKEKIEVPAAVKRAFATKFPGATASWEKEGTQYEAGFKHMGHEMSAVFEENGTMAESEMEIKQAELPATVLAYVKANYKSAKIKEAAKITKANGEVNYEAEVNGKDLIFDASGKFLKETKD